MSIKEAVDYQVARMQDVYNCPDCDKGLKAYFVSGNTFLYSCRCTGELKMYEVIR
ncbi:hypothetical protein LCGC14_1641000 [marine sediment metagenome]|uniref:Uncharacterized protein n=1 Tax=marine sediment metagenome TaxID=412755 RepID=A0A0F9I095_9ZZZZ